MNIWGFFNHAAINEVNIAYFGDEDPVKQRPLF